MTLSADNTIVLTGPGSGLFAEALASGPGGNLRLVAGQDINLTDGATVSAKSSSTGDAGGVSLQSGHGIFVNGSSITTVAEQANGGNIELVTTQMLQLTNGTVSASVGDGIGGNITIDPQFVILQNSQILAQAGAGQGGVITINGNVVLIDPLSVVSASAGPAGISGSVNINAPIKNISGSVAPLPKSFQASSPLLSQRCAARISDGKFSTFVVAGPQAPSIEPGGFLPAPLASVSGPASAGTAASSPATGIHISHAMSATASDEDPGRQMPLPPLANPCGVAG